MDESRDFRGDLRDGSERHGEGSQSTSTVRQEMAATRERMSDTIAELEDRVSGRVAAVKRKVDIGAIVSANPWPSLAVALVAGIALSASGADRRAARATARAAKRAPETAKRGVTAAAAGVSQLASTATDRLTGSGDAGYVGVGDSAERPAGTGTGGLIARLKASAANVAATQADALETELRRGADELPGFVDGRTAI